MVARIATAPAQKQQPKKKKTHHGFAQSPLTLAYDALAKKQVSLAAFGLFGKIAGIVDPSWVLYGRLDILAKQWGCSKKTLMKYLDELVAAGAIEVWNEVGTSGHEMTHIRILPSLWEENDRLCEKKEDDPSMAKRLGFNVKPYARIVASQGKAVEILPKSGGKNSESGGEIPPEMEQSGGNFTPFQAPNKDSVKDTEKTVIESDSASDLQNENKTTTTENNSQKNPLPLPVITHEVKTLAISCAKILGLQPDKKMQCLIAEYADLPVEDIARETFDFVNASKDRYASIALFRNSLKHKKDHPDGKEEEFSGNGEEPSAPTEDDTNEIVRENKANLEKILALKARLDAQKGKKSK